jgi:phage terminase small subunit
MVKSRLVKSKIIERDIDLTDKQKRFCEEYIKDLSPMAAFIRAGYATAGASQGACRLLTYGNVTSYIQELMDKRSKRCNIDADYVLNNIKEVGERCMQKAPVMIYDKSDNSYKQKQTADHKSVWEFDASNALRAQEMLGKHLKLFTDKVEIKVENSLGEELKAARERALNGRK